LIFEGIINFIEQQYNNSESTSIKRWAKEFMDDIICPDCKGNRLKKNHFILKLPKNLFQTLPN